MLVPVNSPAETFTTFNHDLRLGSGQRLSRPHRRALQWLIDEVSDIGEEAFAELHTEEACALVGMQLS
jgi:hypothetical protein